MTRIENAGRPPYWRYSVRMSGVFGQAFGRKKSLTGGFVTSSKYSCNSKLVLRHAKYVYDCETPALASQYMIFGRVNASARKITSGCSRFNSRMHQCQNGSGFVCGLSTRKMRTPLPIQNSKTDFNSVHNGFHSSVSKKNG